MPPASESTPSPNEELLRRLELLEAQMQAVRMSALEQRAFALDGQSYPYHVMRGKKRTWDNERAVELPICWEEVRRHGRPETVIEVGNVLGHYFDTRHRVLDLLERHPLVTWNEDVLEFKPPFAPELVVSISTLEHVGHGQSSAQPEKFRQAVESVLGWLAPHGQLLFTVPLGYNRAVLEYLEDPSPQVVSMLFMRRATLDNLWEQTDLDEVRDYRYGRPFPCANALAIVRARMPGDLRTATWHGGSHKLELRPCDEADFSERGLDDGFSGADVPETIFLAEGPTAVLRSEPVCFAIQPGVRDPQTEHDRRFGRDGAYMARRASICRLPGAIVDTACFLTCPDQHRYLYDSVRGPGAAEWFGYSLLDNEILTREVRDIPDRDEHIVVLGAQSNANYSHWLIESAARAAMFRPFDDGSWLYLTPEMEPWQRQALELVGLSEDRVLEVDSPGLTRFGAVVAVTRGLTKIQELNPTAIDALAALAPKVADRRRLYISRAQAKVRRITNEFEVAEFFAGYGFETVHPQLLAVEEQVRLFAGAEIVAGSHGSGNSGVIFSPPGTVVIELQAEQFGIGGIDYLWNLCAVRSHRFAQIVCRHTPGMDHLSETHRDVTIDLPHLDRTLSPLL
jgi:Glycosyltransferase 61